MIELKGARELALMRIAGKIAAEAMEAVGKAVRPGVTTKELNKIAHELILKRGAKPNFLGYGGYPASICASVNDQVVHGIPSGRKLKEGDIISIDLGAIIHGYNSDMARTFAVGEIAPKTARLIAVTKECFFRGTAQAIVGNRIGDISTAVEEYAVENGFSVVRALVGHGVGRDMHEDPDVPNFYVKRGIAMKPGLVIAIEPMIAEGGWRVHQKEDGWTWVTNDGSPAAHYENTVAVTENGPEILTAL